MAGQRNDTQVDNCTTTSKETRDLQIAAESKASLIGNLSGSQAPCQECNIPCTKTSGTGNPASLATCQDVLDRTEAGAAGSQPDNYVLCLDPVKSCMEIRGTESTPQSQGTCHDMAGCDMQARGTCKASCQDEAPIIPLIEPSDTQDDEALPDNWLSDLEVFIGLADSEDLQTDVAQTELTESIDHGTTDRGKQKLNEIVKENTGASQQDAGAPPAGGKAAIARTTIPQNATTICPAGRSCTRSLISLNGTHPPAESRAPVRNSVCMERRSQARREAQDLRLRLLNLGNSLPERAKMPICPMSPIRADLNVPLDASAPLAVTSRCPMALSALDTSMNADQICKSCNQTKVNPSTLGRDAEKKNGKICHHRRQERHSATPSVRSSLQLQSDSGGSIDIGLNGEDAFKLHHLPMPLMRFSPTLQLAYQLQDPSNMKADNTRMPQFKHSSENSDGLGHVHFEAQCFDLHGNLVDGCQPDTGTVLSENGTWSDLVATCTLANPCHPSVQHGASEEGQMAPSHEVAGNREAPVVADDLSVPPEPKEVLSVSGPVPASGQISDSYLRQTGAHAAYTHCTQAMGVEGSHQACDTLSVKTDQMVSHALRSLARIQPVTDVHQKQTRDANCVQSTTIPPEPAGGQKSAIVAMSSGILQEKSGTASRVAVVGQNKPFSWPTEKVKNASIVPINTSILHGASWVASMEGQNAAKSYMGTGIALKGNTVSAGAEVVHETIATFSVRSETATEAKILGAGSPAAVGDLTKTTHAAGRGVRVAETCIAAGDASYGEANNTQAEEEMQPQKAHEKTPPRSAATNTLDSAQTCTPDLYLLDSAPHYTSASFCRELHSDIFRFSGLHAEDMLPSPDGMDITDIRAMMHQIMATPSCSSFCQISSAEKDPETHDDPPLCEALRVACFRTGLPCHAWAASSCSLSSIVHDRVLKPDSIASQNEIFGLLSPLLHPLSEAQPYACQSSQPAARTQGKTGIGSPFSPLLDARKVFRSSPHPPAASLLLTACQDAKAMQRLDGGVQKATMNQLPADTVGPHYHCQFEFENAKRDAEILAQVWGSFNEPQRPTKIGGKPRRHQAHNVCAADGSSGRNKHSDGAFNRKTRFRQSRCTDSSTDEAGEWQCDENEYYVLPPTLTRAERLSKRQAATCKVEDSPDSRKTGANKKRRDPIPKKCIDRSNWSPRPQFENMTDRDLTTKEPLAAQLLHQQTDKAEDSLNANTAKTEDVTDTKPSLATIEATNMSNSHKGQLPADGAQTGMVSSVPWLTAIKQGPVSFDKEKCIRHNVKNVSTLKDRNMKQELEPPEVDPTQHAYAPSASPQKDRVGPPALVACEMDPPAHAVTPSSPTRRDGKGRQWKCSNRKMGLVSMDTTATMLKERHGNQIAKEGIESATEFCTSTRTARHLRQQSVVFKATHSLVRAQDNADMIWIDGQTRSRSKPTSECNLCTRTWQRLDGVMESARHELLLPVIPCRSRELLALSRAKQSAQPGVQAAPERKGQKRRRPKERACMIKCPCVRSDLNGKSVKGGENCSRFLNSGIC
jgi:hypothetical protein